MITEKDLTNLSNPAAFGVMWTNGDTGSTYQLVNIRGAVSLDFGTRLAGQDRWHSTRVVNPSRFGLTEAPRSFAEFLAIALAYTNG